MSGPALSASAAALGLLLGALWLPASADPALFQTLSVLRIDPPIAAPGVVFRDLHGQPVGLSGLRGRPVLLTFFTTW